MVMKGITVAHIKEHGPGSLLPYHKGPIGSYMYRQVLNIPEGTKLGSR